MGGGRAGLVHALSLTDGSPPSRRRTHPHPPCATHLPTAAAETSANTRAEAAGKDYSVQARRHGGDGVLAARMTKGGGLVLLAPPPPLHTHHTTSPPVCAHDMQAVWRALGSKPANNALFGQVRGEGWGSGEDCRVAAVPVGEGCSAAVLHLASAAPPASTSLPFLASRRCAGGWHAGGCACGCGCRGGNGCRCYRARRRHRYRCCQQCCWGGGVCGPDSRRIIARRRCSCGCGWSCR